MFVLKGNDGILKIEKIHLKERYSTGIACSEVDGRNDSMMYKKQRDIKDHLHSLYHTSKETQKNATVMSVGG